MLQAGAVYLVVAIWGFAIGDGEVIAGLIPVNTADSVLHLALGAVGVGAGLASGTAAAPKATAS